MKHLPCLIAGFFGTLFLFAILSGFNQLHRYEKQHEAHLLRECYRAGHHLSVGPVTEKEMQEIETNCRGVQ